MSTLKSKFKEKTKAVSTNSKPKVVVTPEQRYKMIAEAAYLRAEKCDFESDSAQDWLDAEAEIDRLLPLLHGFKQESESPEHTFVRELEDQLKEWDERFKSIKAKAGKTKSGIQADIKQEIEKLGQQRKDALAKLREFRKDTEEASEDIKTGLEKIWHEMHETLDQVASRFK